MPQLAVRGKVCSLSLIWLLLLCTSVSLSLADEDGSSVRSPTEGPALPSDAGASGASRKPELGEVIEIVICGECNKEVELTSKHGQKCPHCGIEWAIPVAIPKVGSQPASRPNGASEGEVPGGPSLEANHIHGAVPRGNAHAGDAGEQAAPRAPRQLEVPDVPASNMNQMQEMDFANIPLWMKAALFFGSVAVLYYMFFVR